MNSMPQNLSSQSASQPASGESETAREFSSLHHSRSRVTVAINANLARGEVLREVANTFLREGLAQGVLLTSRSWAGTEPAAVLESLGKVAARWPDFQGRDELKQAHAGERVPWSVLAGSPRRQESCFSFCFSTNGKGAIAITGIGSPDANGMIQLRNFFSTEIEHLLIRDRILQAGEPGGPLRDMAECTWATLDEAKEVLTQIATEPAAGQMVARAQLLVKIQELCRYTHIDSGLAELSSSLLVLMHRVHEGPLSTVQTSALRYVLECMRAIRLPHEAVDECLDRLEEAGLDVYDAFGEDDDDQDQP